MNEDKPTREPVAVSQFMRSTELSTATLGLRDTLIKHLPPSRERSIILTKLDEIDLWTGKVLEGLVELEGDDGSDP